MLMPSLGKSLILWLYLCLITGPLFAQLSVYQHYTADDGLTSSEIFDIIQDSTGHIWFATGYGICRFDGYTFRTFTTKEGLPANSTVVAFLDDKGRPWFSSYEGYISWFEQERFHSFPLNDTISKLANNYNVANVVVYPDGSVKWKPQKVNALYQYDSLYTLSRIPPPKNPGNNYHLYFYPDSIGVIWDFFTIPEYTKAISTNVFRSGDTTYIRFSVNRFPTLLRPRYQRVNADSWLLSVYNKLWFIEKDSLIREMTFSNNINHQLLDPYGNLWLAVEYEGIYLYPPAETGLPVQHLFPGQNVTKMILDRERNLWIGTIENGVYLIPSLQFFRFRIAPGTENMKIMSLGMYNHRLWFSTYGKRLYHCDIRGTDCKPVPVGFSTTTINDLFPDNFGNLWLLGIDYLGKMDPEGHLKTFHFSNRISFFDGLAAGSDTIYIGTSNGLLGFGANHFFLETAQHAFSRAIRTVCLDKHNGLWLGTFDGLFRYNDTVTQEIQSASALYKSRITDILCQGSYLVCGTRSEGMVIQSMNDSFLLELTTDHGLTSNMINVLYAEDSVTLWVGTNTGLNRIDLSNRDSIVSSVISFSKWDGLPVSQINDIVKAEGVLWLATDRGLISFIPESIRPTRVAPKLMIEHISINDKDTVLLPFYDLHSYQNTLNIQFKGISMRDPGNVSYRYKLEGFDPNWIETKNSMIRYFMLPSGDYVFHLMSSGVDGVWNETPVTFSFRIQKHVTRKWWFLLLVIGVSFMIIVLVFLLILKNQRRKAALQRALLLSEQKALRAQMNPHFLFNSLNSIQNLIFKGEEKKADFYLSNFSALMRKILEHSRHNNVSLSSELETIRLYIELEKLRFGEGFEFFMQVDAMIEPDLVEIPPMLIQPFLENAILHGLLLKEGEKKLLVRFTIDAEGILTCLIEDNGIGRKKSQSQRPWRKDHHSMGQKNVEERLELMNAILGQKFSLKISDIYLENNQPGGTRVEILMPLMHT